LNLFSEATVIVDVAEAPGATGPILVGLAVTLKSTTVTEPVRHWLGVVEQLTTKEPSGALTEEGSDGVLT
jgi:hypothetical protein